VTTWHDEREHSVADATSFAVVRRRRIREALAFGGEFAATGFMELRQRWRGRRQSRSIPAAGRYWPTGPGSMSWSWSRTTRPAAITVTGHPVTRRPS
jgi:hypothetical protein